MNVAADKPLTAKQQKFAAAVANGKPAAAAARETYVMSKDPRHAGKDRQKAAMMAKQPHIAAEIRRLMWLSMPNMDDLRGMRGQAIRVIADLSRSAKSEQVKLAAAGMLYKIAETSHAASAPSATSEEQERMLSALRKLYAQIQGLPVPVDITPADLPKATLDDLPAANLTDDDAPVDVTALACHGPGDGNPGDDAAEHPRDEEADEPDEELDDALDKDD